MKLLGIDHGNARIGIAISDPLGMAARPLKIIRHVSRSLDAQEIFIAAVENDCEGIVVGIPLDSEGNIGPRARSVLRFVDELKSISTLPVYTWDESNSTKKALRASIARGEKKKNRKEAMDHHAAAFILQDYLDFLRQSEESE
ncbi:MAG TPA: Holliday junction resolvase RuvX [Chloroflexi bacterium]|jgi:putative Holliday junction resolvase|nr:Holliday junction resolvase RuvX [Anaerolineaceae bacterium]HHX09650.1 Holliday junction resolvase RuvX [Chloroflexota bacterium]